MGRNQCSVLVPGGNLTCQRPIHPCVLRLKPQVPVDQGTDDAAIGVLCRLATPAHLAVMHYLRLVAAGDDLTDWTPRLAEALQADQQAATRIADAVAAGCRDLREDR